MSIADIMNKDTKATPSTTTKYAGVDLSKWQTGVDYVKLQKAKIQGKQVKYAFLRMSYSTSLDSMFRTHYKGCTEAGLHIGVYVYSMAKTVNEAIAEARWVLNTIKANKLDIQYPIVFDYEDEKLLNLKLSKSAYTAIADAFMSTIKAANFYPMLYTNPDWLLNRFNKELLLSKYDLWLAHWTSEGNQKQFGQMIWQYGVDQVSGVNGDVDVNWCYIGYNKLIGTKLDMNHFIKSYTLSASKSDITEDEKDDIIDALKSQGFNITIKEN